MNQWIGESRNFYRDFKRFYPDEEPAEVVRVYLMSDSDNTGSRVTGAFADLIFSSKASRVTGNWAVGFDFRLAIPYLFSSFRTSTDRG